MNRLIKRVIALVLSLSIVFSVVACGTTKNASNGKNKDVRKIANGQVWTAPSTVKIKREEVDYVNKGKAELSYQAVRNEYESCQLIITADRDIEHFELKASDLKNGKEILSKENVEVYVQKYVYFSEYGDNGYMPDALIPMKNADEYDENQIKAGNNGALWVTIKVPKEAKAGVYEGSFQLVVESKKKNEKIDIPVSLEVYDYTLSDEMTAKNTFSWRYNRVAPGELDGSIEMMQKYYDFFLDYRISLQAMPVEALTGEEFVAAVKKYYDVLPSYSLITPKGGIYQSGVKIFDILQTEIFALAEASTTDRNLFDKAMIYYIDEPDFTSETRRKEVIASIESLNAQLQLCVDAIKADNSGKYDEFKKIDDWENYILDIPNVITGIWFYWLEQNEDTEDAQKLLKLLNAICPQFHQVNGDLSFWDKYDIDVWWYGCMGPKPTAPTYHISDKNLLSARTVSWLQSKYEVKGNLYWDAAAYTDESAYPQFTDLYELPYRSTTAGWPAGDGFLSYPGAAYGVYGPIASLRLMSIRDGMEEYELLEDIKQKLSSKSSTFDSTLMSEAVLNRFYNPIARNSGNMYADGEQGLNFIELREELLQLVSGISEGTGLIIGNIIVKGDKAEVEYYVQKGATVTIDGKKQEPVSGLLYQYNMDLSKDTYIHMAVANKNGKQVNYDRFISEPVYNLCTFSEQAELQYVQVTDGSKVELVKDNDNSTDGTSLHCEVNGVVTGNMLVDATFVPSVSVSTKAFNDIKTAELSALRVDMYNPGEAFSVTLKLYSGNSFTILGVYELENGMSTLEIDLPKDFADIDKADRFAWEFSNVNGENVAASYEFYIDNMVGDK